MKLVIQVPCYNEASTLGAVLSSLPREVAGFDAVEWLVVDDGSTDRTVEVARSNGADHVVLLPRNHGLARAFMAGVGASLSAGADVIVNTDGDNQYCADDIPLLVGPILAGKAEIVIGTRPIAEIASFSPLKKLLLKIGTFVVRLFSNTDIQDAPSGFRAMTREAAMRLNIYNRYTYTLEMIIQAGQKDIAVTSVPIRVNPVSRPSRLIRSIPDYVLKSVVTIVRIFVVYKPFKSFITIGMACLIPGFLVGLRYLYLLRLGEGAGHTQSLILASVLLGVGFQTILSAFVADLLAVNRRLLEDVQYRLQKSAPPPDPLPDQRKD
ncbi:MAG TPA: glycosyltransferase family 2 protein [Candidatus Deferrimicrobiaceae bacterium]